MFASASPRARPHRVLWAALALLATLVPQTTAHAAALVVHAGESIQAAVDAAEPGDVILVRPGLYTAPRGAQAVFRVQTDDLTLIGLAGAIIDAGGAPYAGWVGADLRPGTQGCPAEPAVRNFHMHGFTIQHAKETGLRLAGVERYRLTKGVYQDNGDRGLRTVCSAHGRIDHNYAAGHRDAAISLGSDEDTLVDWNVVSGNAIGIQVGNSLRAVVRHNLAVKNTAGIWVLVLPGRPIPRSLDVRIERNWIADNNLSNPRAGEDSRVSRIPSGTGILNVGGDDVRIQHNVIRGNGTQGVAILGNPLGLLGADARLDPFVDGGELGDNAIFGNGGSPDAARAIASGDVIFLPDVVLPVPGVFPPAVAQADPDPFDNCFGRNLLRKEVVFASRFPDLGLRDFRCDHRPAVQHGSAASLF